MFNQSPYGGYPYPQQPVVFIPQTGTPPTTLADQIAAHLSAAEILKKLMKEEKKDDKDKDKRPDPRIASMMLFMILISPVTGPVMSHFFEWGRGMLH